MSHAFKLVMSGSLLFMVAAYASASPASTTPDTARVQPPLPCVCSPLEKLEYKPVSPAEPTTKLYVGNCQCGAMSCVVTTGAIQCTTSK